MNVGDFVKAKFGDVSSRGIVVEMMTDIDGAGHAYSVIVAVLVHGKITYFNPEHLEAIHECG